MGVRVDQSGQAGLRGQIDVAELAAGGTGGVLVGLALDRAGTLRLDPATLDDQRGLAQQLAGRWIEQVRAMQHADIVRGAAGGRRRRVGGLRQQQRRQRGQEGSEGDGGACVHAEVPATVNLHHRHARRTPGTPAGAAPQDTERAIAGSCAGDQATGLEPPSVAPASGGAGVT